MPTAPKPGRLPAPRLEIIALDDIHQRLQIRSSAPVWEPLLTLRIEVSQATMRVVRELPILLDPPSAEDPLASGVAGVPDQADAIDSRMALANAAPMPTATVQAAAAVPAERSNPVRSSAKTSAATDFTLPAPRFQLAAALSAYSLVWLQDNPQPALLTGSDPESATAAVIEVESTDTRRENTAPAAAGRDAVERTAAPLHTAAAAPAHPRGLPMGSPWRVLLLMAAVTIGLFAYARRMRRSLMSDKALLV